MHQFFTTEAYLAFAVLFCAMAIATNTAARMIGNFWTPLSIPKDEQGKLISPFFKYIGAADLGYIAPFMFMLVSLFAPVDKGVAPQDFGYSTEGAMNLMIAVALGAIVVGGLTIAWVFKELKSAADYEVATVYVGGAFVAASVMFTLLLLLLVLFAGGPKVDASFFNASLLILLGAILSANYGTIFRNWITKQFMMKHQDTETLEAGATRRAIFHCALTLVPTIGAFVVLFT